MLQPLVDEGRLRVIDATDTLAAEPDAGCHDYFDFFRQNDSGRAAPMQTLLPRIRAASYGDAPEAASAAATVGG